MSLAPPLALKPNKLEGEKEEHLKDRKTRAEEKSASARAKKEYYMPKREVTLTKIQMASQAIKEENRRRKKHNIKARKDFKKGKEGKILPIIYPAAVPTARKTPDNMVHVKGMTSVTHANKRLCGRLSSLCVALKEAGLPYPWAEGGV